MGLRSFLAAAALAAALVPLAAAAQSFRCVGKDGKTYYGSTIPNACIGQPIEQLNMQGMVIRRIDPAGAERDRQAKEAEAAKRREHEAAARELARRNRALLATYTSAEEIDEARARALKDHEKAVNDLKERIEAIAKRQAGYQREMEFFQGKNKAPARLTQDLSNAAIDLKTQQGLLEAKIKEVELINAKYDQDSKRYLELTRRR
jgi:hypothetical protein